MDALTPRSRHAGFTLIELAVVMLLITIVLGMVGLNLQNDDQPVVQDEAQRLVLLVQSAQQESILNARVLALRFNDDGYEFLALNEANELVALSGDELLRPRRLPAGMAMEDIAIDGLQGGEEQDAVIMFPTGELTGFGVTFAKGKAKQRIEGGTNGEIKPVPRA